MAVFKELFDYRQMIVTLIHKDLRGRYKGSVFGFLWTFINPLFQLLIYNFVFSTILKSNIEKFYLYLFIALVPWGFFSASMTTGSTSVLAQGGMVKKIYFPREVLPIAYVTSSFVNMLYCFVIVFAMIIVSGTRINILALFYLPIVMAVEYILAIGIALITSAITVYFRDLEHILGIVSMALMFLTPIVYPLEAVPQEYQGIYDFNPMVSVIAAYRDILYNGEIPKIETLARAFVLGVLLFVVGLIVFGLLKRHFAEEL
ncbi:MAG: ABC transporter permease [Clostridiales bacterium]|jgi:ABC-2 type transport system permease protein|nr:ABC transporter permease [Clostridiales bacterium]